MKYLPIALLFTVISCIAFSCLKSNDQGCQSMAPETEEPQMKAFCSSHNINYTRLSNSLYYQVIDSGNGAAPSSQSVIKATYTGTLLNGNIFDQTSTPVQMRMADLIEGWRQGLPLVKKGGRILLIIPSYLGYGCTAQKGIPANSVLYFDITLTDVQ